MRTIVREPKATPAPPREFGLPSAGRLLVTGADGLFVVNRSGRKSALGDYQDASWSPRGLFVAATRTRTLVALDPASGAVRWKVQPGGAVSLPRWGPDGLHVAYRAGRSLRIVYGNGEHDVVAGRSMAAVAPAWRPNAQRTVAWAATDGTVTVEDADTAKVLRTYRSGGVRQLAWSGDGRKLLIAGRRHGTIHDFATGRTTRLTFDGDLLAAAYGHGLALAVQRGTRTEIRVRVPSSCRPRAASTTSRGRRTAAGCSRATLRRESGSSRGQRGGVRVLAQRRAAFRLRSEDPGVVLLAQRDRARGVLGLRLAGGVSVIVPTSKLGDPGSRGSRYPTAGRLPEAYRALARHPFTGLDMFDPSAYINAMVPP